MQVQPQESYSYRLPAVVCKVHESSPQLVHWRRGCRSETRKPNHEIANKRSSRINKWSQGFSRLPDRKIGRQMQTSTQTLPDKHSQLGYKDFRLLRHASALGPVSPSGCAESRGSTRNRCDTICRSEETERRQQKKEPGELDPLRSKNYGD